MFPRAKKSLGQNFLKSSAALAAIIGAGSIKETDTILEIGPGRGALTERLVAVAGKTVAVEKDDDLASMLVERFADDICEKKLSIINADILSLDPSALMAEAPAYKLIANIPYYITGAIIRKFLESAFQPTQMVLLVQKEVAERIVARDGKESLLSISVKAYGTPVYVKKVPAKSFSPSPKVDSAIISIEGISKKAFSDIEGHEFFSIVKAGFAHKRKTLAKNLATLRLAPERLKEGFDAAGISWNARAENVSISQWRTVAAALAKESTRALR